MDTDAHQCEAITQKETRCSRNSINGETFCWQHVQQSRSGEGTIESSKEEGDLSNGAAAKNSNSEPASSIQIIGRHLLKSGKWVVSAVAGGIFYDHVKKKSHEVAREKLPPQSAPDSSRNDRMHEDVRNRTEDPKSKADIEKRTSNRSGSLSSLWEEYQSDRQSYLPIMIDRLKNEARNIEDLYDVRCENPSVIEPAYKAQQLTDRALDSWKRGFHKEGNELADRAITTQVISVLAVYKTIAAHLIVEARYGLEFSVDVDFKLNKTASLLAKAREFYARVRGVETDNEENRFENFDLAINSYLKAIELCESVIRLTADATRESSLSVITESMNDEYVMMDVRPIRQ